MALQHENYTYHNLKRYKSGASIWRCSKYQRMKCHGSITIKEDRILTRKPHSCDWHVALQNFAATETAYKFKQNMY